MKKIIALASIFFLAFTSYAAAMDKLIISDGWLRVAPNQVAGAFFEIQNHTSKPINIISATASGAKTTELHSHTMTDGIMKMRKEDSVEIPANGTLSFNPHSFHLMMFKLDKQAFAVGNMVEVTLTFDDQSTLGAKFHVIKFGTEMKKDMDHSKMDHSKMDHSKMTDHKMTDGKMTMPKTK
ncbi:MAG: copper chaperone PCu(A)C [Hyphomicrobiales bacterium]